MSKLLLSILFVLLSTTLFSQQDSAKIMVAPPVSIHDSSSFAIFNLSIKNDSGTCISLKHCSNVKIFNCELGSSKNEGIRLEDCKNVDIGNCLLYNNSTCIYVIRSAEIRIRHTQFLNVHGPYPRGQFIQFNSVFGAGNMIEDNSGKISRSCQTLKI